MMKYIPTHEFLESVGFSRIYEDDEDLTHKKTGLCYWEGNNRFFLFSIAHKIYPTSDEDVLTLIRLLTPKQ